MRVLICAYRAVNLEIGACFASTLEIYVCTHVLTYIYALSISMLIWAYRAVNLDIDEFRNNVVVIIDIENKMSEINNLENEKQYLCNEVCGNIADISAKINYIETEIDNLQDFVNMSHDCDYIPSSIEEWTDEMYKFIEIKNPYIYGDKNDNGIDEYTIEKKIIDDLSNEGANLIHNIKKKWQNELNIK